jgi:hypothetical protein
MPNEYRHRAAECLRLANECNDPQNRALLLEMAQAWLRLLDQAEKNSQVDIPYEVLVALRLLRAQLKLTRFRGHPNICVQGVHDGEDETTLHT